MEMERFKGKKVLIVGIGKTGFSLINFFNRLECEIRVTDIKPIFDLNKSVKKLKKIDSFKKYDNYDAINVNKTQDIPMDYDGFMGVPITFLHKYNPEQFELIKFRKGNDERDLSINGKCPYFRIIIKNRRL